MPGIVAMASECAAGQGCQQRERLGEVHNFAGRWTRLKPKQPLHFEMAAVTS